VDLSSVVLQVNEVGGEECRVALAEKPVLARHEERRSRGFGGVTLSVIARARESDWIMEARSIFQCALLCIEELADPHDPERRRHSGIPDVAVLVTLGIERIALVKEGLERLIGQKDQDRRTRVIGRRG